MAGIEPSLASRELLDLGPALRTPDNLAGDQ